MDTNVMVGAYTKFSTEITADEKAVFDQAINGLVGVNYAPLAVATQVVAGTNYKFFCNATPVYPGAVAEGAMVSIYKPLDGDAHITQIRMCE